MVMKGGSGESVLMGVRKGKERGTEWGEKTVLRGGSSQSKR